MRNGVAGAVSPGKTAASWHVFQEIMTKSLWITAGVIVVMGIVGCSSATPRVNNREIGRSNNKMAKRTIDYSAPSRTGTKPSRRLVRTGRLIPKGGGSYKIGRPYRVAGRLYVPREQPGYNKSGKASWYGADFHGRKTANGEVFDMNALTAAHPTLPLPSYAYVTNMRNNRTVMVRINDRGPYAHNRIIDLSRAVGRALGFEQQGITDVKVRYAGRAPLNGDDRREVRFFKSQRWSGQFASNINTHKNGYFGLGGPRRAQFSTASDNHRVPWSWWR